MEYNFYRVFGKRISALAVILSILSTSLLPSFAKPAEAQWVVVDPALIAQVVLEAKKSILERIIDGGARVAANIAIERIVGSTVKWANSGFEGNPAYVTDPKQYFGDIADGVAGEFIQGSDLGFLCSPFQASIKLSLASQYYNPRPFQCTLTGVQGNIENFYKDFNQGGWDTWFSMTQNENNNPYGAYLNAKIELDSRIAQRIGLKNQELNWNQGYLSWSNCAKKDPNTGKCLERGPTKTPGAHIKSQLDKVLPSGLDKLISVKYVEDLAVAFATGILKKYVFGSEGLFGADGKKGVTTGSNARDVDGDGIPDGIDNDGNGTVDACFYGGTTSVLGPPCKGSIAAQVVDAGGGGGQCLATGEKHAGALRSAMDAVLAENPSVAALPNIETGGRQNARTFLALVESKLISMGYNATDDVLNGNNNPNTGDLIAVWNEDEATMERYDAIIGAAATIREAAQTDFTGFIPLNCTASGGGTSCGCSSGGGNENTPPPGSEPLSLLQDLQTERAKFGTPMTKADIGKLLNNVVYANRADGWKLLGKSSGNNCPAPGGQLISCDYLVHQGTYFGYDVLIDEDGSGTPSWQGPSDLQGSISDGSRTFVDAIAP